MSDTGNDSDVELERYVIYMHTHLYCYICEDIPLLSVPTPDFPVLLTLWWQYGHHKKINTHSFSHVSHYHVTVWIIQPPNNSWILYFDSSLFLTLTDNLKSAIKLDHSPPHLINRSNRSNMWTDPNHSNRSSHHASQSTHSNSISRRTGQCEYKCSGACEDFLVWWVCWCVVMWFIYFCLYPRINKERPPSSYGSMRSDDEGDDELIDAPQPTVTVSLQAPSATTG